MAWYDVGTVSVTNGSTTVTGSGTDFISGVQVGEGLYIGGDLYEIATIVSGTELTLADAYLGSTATGQDYKIIPTQSLVADLSSGVADLISDFADVRDYAGNGKFNDGSVSSPAITFTQDQNNGLYRIGSDNWGLVAGGSKQLEIKTTGVKLDDNKKVTFGASDDLQIYHDGSHSYVSDAGTGHLRLTGTNLLLEDGSGTDYIYCASDAVHLYNANNLKLKTTSTGVDVTGTLSADGLTVDTAQGNITVRSDASAIDFGRDGSNYLRATGASGDFRFTTGNVGYGNVALTIDDNNDVYFYEDTGTTAKMVWSSSAESLNVGSSQLNFSTTKVQTGSATSPAAGFNVFTSSTGDGYLLFSDGNTGSQSYTGQIRYNHGSNFMAFGTNGGAERMRIDSSGNVGIGTASPNTKLDINPSTANTNAIKLNQASGASAGNYTSLGSQYSGGSSFCQSQVRFGVESTGAGTGFLAFATGTNSATERARIDSSGNLLVGTTSIEVYNGTSTGVAMTGSGYIFAGKSGDAPMYLNRISNDGAIVNFSKDGATVGSIGSIAGQYLSIGTGDTGLAFDDDADLVVPWNTSTNANRSNNISLGSGTQRFKDLYLSGGVYLGGTGADNKLDDYEEGDWFPSITGSTSGSIGSTISIATYTKIGNVVNVRCYLHSIDVNAHTIVGNVLLSGLPFVPVSFTGACSVHYTNILTTDEKDESIQGYPSSSSFYVLLRGSSSTAVTAAELNTGITSGTIMFSATYETTA